MFYQKLCGTKIVDLFETNNSAFFSIGEKRRNWRTE